MDIPIELLEIRHNLSDRDWDISPVYAIDKNEADKAVKAIDELKSDKPVGEWVTLDATHDKCPICKTVMCIKSISTNDVGYCPYCGSRLKKRW